MSQEHPETLLVMDADAIRKAIRRIAHEIVERNTDLSRLVIAGIPTRGVEVAKRILDHIEQIEGVRPEFGVVDVAMHRDDLRRRGRLTAVVPTELPVDLDDRVIVLVDDVLFTGRSCRAALDAISSFGRPARVQYAVLVDRGHRELPIRADYVGKNVPTALEEKIRVRFENLDSVPDSVRVVRAVNS
ncbi:pyrimidine operon attenuation protein / uracil phosphoribosyltransferase [Terrimicrobium sacchariphilum]|jgi:pyrimidine operon attenuation protein/uracil phosphoribosyltransferase|uniref:Bifunctional protein PyrR n=1 Tax=Terrimicrobium sacchariphilum TaxID=690879 RepID=A0A146GBC7_TERSA|nr:bifunctional pyr operon transcriptional regulator/uracil phosphoribosyltransferase PyrR [Terrimicrobium sacchariphilum]GAT34114.1 pyrimidine operon attenuation protein / uracil phosphoribosyltransferase [Terrimicrobium sacchariphilum]